MLPVTISVLAAGSLLYALTHTTEMHPMTPNTNTVAQALPKLGDFHSAVSAVLAKNIEGGYSNNPNDRGGATNRGISIREVRRLDADVKLDAYLRKAFDVNKDGEITEADVPGWSEPIAVYFYRNHYWDVIRGNELPHSIALMTFDSAVNEGTPRAILHLQRALGVTPDGIVGPDTIAAAIVAANRSIVSDLTVPEKMFLSRVDRYRTLDDADTFFKGWLTRSFRILKVSQSFGAQGGTR